METVGWGWGVAVPFCWGMSSLLGHRPTRYSFLICYLNEPASQLMTLTQSNLKRGWWWGGGIKGQLNIAQLCTHAVGRKMQSCTFVLGLYGEGAKAPPTPFGSQPPGILLCATWWSQVEEVAHSRAWVWLCQKESLRTSWARLPLFENICLLTKIPQLVH